MKTITYYTLITIVLCSMSACGFDRSVRPKAGAAPEIEIKDAKIFTLSNGMKVFLVENHKLPTVYYSLSLDVRPKTDSEKAGLETMFSEVFGTASKTRSKEEINLGFDMAGANFNFNSRSASISGLVNYQNEMLANFADVLFNVGDIGSRTFFPSTHLRDIGDIGADAGPSREFGRYFPQS